MKQWMFVGALALGLAAPALAQMPMGPMSKADYMARGKAQFEAGDANHDGAITKEELNAVMTSQMGSAPPQNVLDGIFNALDTDHDGKITAAEADKLRNDSFDKADANHDGTLTPEEIEAARAAAMAAHQPK
jgi:Ca2+-binding EF-hand superfamily protein